jgi:hypothetical protein
MGTAVVYRYRFRGQDGAYTESLNYATEDSILVLGGSPLFGTGKCVDTADLTPSGRYQGERTAEP